MAPGHEHSIAEREQIIIVPADVGGNDIKLGATDLFGNEIRGSTVKIASHGDRTPDDVVGQVCQGVDQVLRKTHRTRANVLLVPMAFPAPCDALGNLIAPPNLGSETTKALWATNVNLGEKVAHALEKPVYGCNDGNAAARDEFERRYPNSKQRSVVHVTTGTGVGGGIVYGGRVLIGQGQGGELGHVIVKSTDMLRDNPLCGCGANGCVEARASLKALERRIGEALADPLFLKLEDHTTADLRALYAENRRAAAYKIRDLAEQNQPLARHLMAEWATTFGLLAVNSAKFIHPDIFTIGGGLRESSDEFRNWFIDIVRATYFFENKQSCHDNMKIEWSTSVDTGWRGAALMAIDAGAVRDALAAW